MDQLLAMRVFIRIAEAGGFAKAADAMDVPRATATKLVQDLERHLGVRLFQRTTRRVTVTPEGAAYYERAARLIAELNDMDESLQGAAARPKGRLRVDVGSSLANLLLIPELPKFQKRYPELHLDLGVSDRNVDLVGEGVDCTIRGGELADTSLVARRLADLDWVTCASRGYLRAHGKPRHPGDLVEGDPGRTHAIVGYFSSLTGRHFPLEFERGEEQLSIPVNSSVAVNESTAHLNALLAGLGVGQTFRFMAEPHLQSGALVEVLGDWHRPRHPLQLVYPAPRHLHAKVRVFSDWAAEVFARVDARLA